MIHGGDIYRNKVDMDFSVNLNPLGTPSVVSDAVRTAFDKALVYPDIRQENVRKAVALFHGCERDCVYAGNGASELIMSVVRAEAPAKALILEPVFTGYEYALNSVDCDISRYILNEKDDFALSDFNPEVISEDTDMVFICDPVNPTGLSIDNDIISQILERAETTGTAVCIDESFLPMSDKALLSGGQGSTELVKKYRCLYVIRSLTKMFGIPGIRAGYVISSPANIEKIRRQLPEWNLSCMADEAICTGMKYLRESDFIKDTVEEIKKEREYLSECLRSQGFRVYESSTSYIMMKGPEDLYDELLKRGVLIRDLSEYTGLGKGFYRIAVKGHKENERFTEILRGRKNG